MVNFSIIVQRFLKIAPKTLSNFHPSSKPFIYRQKRSHHSLSVPFLTPQLSFYGERYHIERKLPSQRLNERKVIIGNQNGYTRPLLITKPCIRLHNALRAVRNNKSSIQKAATVHNVSNAMLQPRSKDLSQEHGIKTTEPGRHTALT